MRFGKKHHARYAARIGKLMPGRLFYRMKIHLANNVREEHLEYRHFAKRGCITAVSLHDPLTPAR